MDLLGKMKDWLTMGAVPLAGLALAAAVALFIPASLLDALGLSALVKDYRHYLGATLVVATSLLICTGGKGIWDAVLKPLLKETLAIRAYRKEMHALTEEEKDYLRPYLDQQTRSQCFALNDGIAMGLQSRKIIIRASNLGMPGYGFMFPFQIQPWAWEYLNRHPELVTPNS
jgi:hypothetical protein